MRMLGRLARRFRKNGRTASTGRSSQRLDAFAVAGREPQRNSRGVAAARAEAETIAQCLETEYRELDGNKGAGAELAQVLRAQLAMVPAG